MPNSHIQGYSMIIDCAKGVKTKRGNHNLLKIKFFLTCILFKVLLLFHYQPSDTSSTAKPSSLSQYYMFRGST